MAKAKSKPGATPASSDLLATLQKRFEANPGRHKGVQWADVQSRIESQPGKRKALQEMESTGGDPDVVAVDRKTGEVIFYDCSAETPAGRRSICFDPEALASRKEHKPAGSALGMAKSMGIEILTEQEYRQLQQLGEFDLKTSSWVATPPAIRKLGGALFCDRRYDQVFTYHNGAESYYAARGFRASLRV